MTVYPLMKQCASVRRDNDLRLEPPTSESQRTYRRRGKPTNVRSSICDGGTTRLERLNTAPAVNFDWINALRKHSSAWKVLRAGQAPLILTFLEMDDRRISGARC